MNRLDNYRELVARVDELCHKTAAEYSRHLACKPGCDSCCRHLSLFPVEGAALVEALHKLPADQAAKIREKAAAASPDGHCPLLEEGRCLLYTSRPIICRTHGLPLLISNGSNQQVDFCPRNFRDISSLPGSAVIDLDRLNAALTAINAHFISESGKPDAAERLTMAEALQRHLG